MLTGTSAPITIRHDRPVSESVWEGAFPPDGQSSGLPGRETRGRVETQELSPGLFLLHSELRFDRETELREEYPESGVFQLSFCLSGCMEWEFEGGRGGKYAHRPHRVQPAVGTVFPVHQLLSAGGSLPHLGDCHGKGALSGVDPAAGDCPSHLPGAENLLSCVPHHCLMFG